MKHTKEPWKAKGEFVDSIEGYSIARCHWCNGEQGEIDAKRIVACVNACKGITTEALEAGIVCASITSNYFVNGIKVREDEDGK